MMNLDKLEVYLLNNGIHYQRVDETHTFDGDIVGNRHQIIVFHNHKRVWDVVCHRGSYGYEDDLLEAMGEIFGGIKGWLSAEDVISILEGGNKHAN